MTSPLALVIHAHPDPESFNRHLADIVASELTRRYDVEFVDLYALGFDPVMSADEWRRYRDGRASDRALVAAHGDLVSRASALVFVFPTWWGSLPAILRGWLEQVLRPGVAFEYREGGGIVPALTGVDLVAGVTTYGSPRWRMTLVGDGGRRMLLRALRMNAGRRVTTKWMGLHDIDTSTEAERRRFAARVRREARSW